MANEIIGKVFATMNYDQFKYLDGNRSVKDGRVNKILNSIDEVGYIPAPIIVNEKMEIIDGQGRLEACRRRKIPISYLVIKGIGINECTAMNINQSNWTINDYIERYKDDQSIYNLNNAWPEGVSDAMCTEFQNVISGTSTPEKVCQVMQDKFDELNK